MLTLNENDITAIIDKINGEITRNEFLARRKLGLFNKVEHNGIVDGLRIAKAIILDYRREEEIDPIPAIVAQKKHGQLMQCLKELEQFN